MKRSPKKGSFDLLNDWLMIKPFEFNVNVKTNGLITSD